MDKVRIWAYVDPEVAETLDTLGATIQRRDKKTRSAPGQVIQEALEMWAAAKNGAGVYVDLSDAELKRQFGHLCKNNDMSPADVTRKLIRREYFDMTDRGSNQRNLIRHIYVLVRIAVFLLLQVAAKQGIVFSPTPTEDQALRDSVLVELNKESKL